MIPASLDIDLVELETARDIVWKIAQSFDAKLWQSERQEYERWMRIHEELTNLDTRIEAHQQANTGGHAA